MMTENNRTVIGSYASREEALNTVDHLKKEGYQKKDILLYSNGKKSLGDHEAVDVTADGNGTDTGKDQPQDDDRSMWDKVKDAFTPETYDQEDEEAKEGYSKDDDILYSYREDINKGNVIVVVEGEQGKNLEAHNSSGALLNANRDTQSTEDPLTRGRDFDQAADNKDNFRN